MAKTVRVHDDTHEELKGLKASRRSSSLDQVIRELIRSATGKPVGAERARRETDKITSFVKD